MLWILPYRKSLLKPRPGAFASERDAKEIRESCPVVGDWTWEVVMLHLFSFLKGFFVQDEALGGSKISSTSQHQRDSGLAHERSHPGISRKKSGIGKPLVDSLAVNFPRVISFR